MNKRKLFNLIVTFFVIASTMIHPSGQVGAMPASPTDETKVPHYFGPYPNWANSPFTLPDVTVNITGNGTGAQATATVGGNGAITGIDITDPGSGYTSASVSITGAGTGATATASVTLSGIVNAINVVQSGAGYTRPAVAFSGGGPVSPVQVGNPLVDRAFATDFEVAPIIIPANVAPLTSRSYDVTVGSANGGTFTLTVDSTPTAPIAWNALAADVQLALSSAGVTAAVTGSGTTLDPWTIVFATAPAAITLDPTGLQQIIPVVDAAATVTAAPETYNVTVGSATGGTFTLTVDAAVTGPIAWNAPAGDVQTALASAGITAAVTGSGSIVDPWVITFAVAPAAVLIDPVNLTQTLAVSDASLTANPTDTYSAHIGSASGGTFTLTVDAVTTGAIAWNALAADVTAALSTAGITATVTGSGTAADPWVIVFATAPATVSIDGANLTYPTAPTTVPAFVVLPTSLPTGTLKSFLTQNQASAAGSPTPSAGEHFNAYVLRPTGVANQYTVVFDSGTLTVPALANPTVSETAAFPVADVAIQAGDMLAFYGAGIPVDTGVGTDLYHHPVLAAPVQGATI
ncbi:MAG TPA: hypothetical protein VHO48_08545, partial [Anaerolineaceae bacterium]|nr:hypothetical protein [Anaerolineaceae bacterium]